MPAARVCPVPGCPELTTGGRCPTHEREADRARGTRQQRGYDAKHDALRRVKAAEIEAGQVVVCPHCHGRVMPGQAWDLDHTTDRRGYRGAAHASCNRSAGGRAAHE